MKHYPFPRICILQVLVLYALPLISLIFPNIMDWPILWLPIGIIAFLWSADLLVLILSLTIGWNAPIQITADGISKKKGSLHRWSDATGFSRKNGPRISYGRLYRRAIIKYSDGTSLSFELNNKIIKTILSQCSDEEFISRFQDLLEDEYWPNQ